MNMSDPLERYSRVVPFLWDEGFCEEARLTAKLSVQVGCPVDDTVDSWRKKYELGSVGE